MSEARRLADEVRRVIESLQVVDLTPEESAAYANLVHEIADDLRARPHRASWHHDPEIGLETAFSTLEADGRHWAHAERSPVSGTLNPAAPPLTMSIVDTDDGQRLRGHVTLSAIYEGAPRTVHGGVVAALFDELLGYAQRIARVAGYTGTITTVFRAPTPTYTTLQLEAWPDRVEGRKIFIAGTLHAGGVLCAEAEGIFINPVKG